MALADLEHDAERAQAARRARAPASPTRSTPSRSAARPRDLHHRPVRAQPRRRRQLLPLRLVRDEATASNTLPALAPGRRLPDRDGRQVAERLRGARTRHGEVPKGFEIWRGLLDVSAYDYFNFVMNARRRAARLGRRRLRRASWSSSRTIEVDDERRRLPRSSRGSSRAVRPAALRLLGRRGAARTTPPTSPARSPRKLVRGQRPLAQAVLHLVVAGGAAPRGRGDHAHGPSGPRSAARAPPRRRSARAIDAAAAAELQRARHLRQALEPARASRRR